MISTAKTLVLAGLSVCCRPWQRLSVNWRCRGTSDLGDAVSISAASNCELSSILRLAHSNCAAVYRTVHVLTFPLRQRLLARGPRASTIRARSCNKCPSSPILSCSFYSRSSLLLPSNSAICQVTVCSNTSSISILDLTISPVGAGFVDPTLLICQPKSSNIYSSRPIFTIFILPNKSQGNRHLRADYASPDC